MSTTSITDPGAAASSRFDIPVELYMLDEANRIVAARIRRVSPSLFELSCSENLRAGQRLALSHEGRRIEVVVSSAVRGETGVYSLAVKVVADDFGEVRSELRLPTELTAALTVAGETKEIKVEVVDMSPSGMGLESPVELARGAKVCVNLDQGLAFGEIRFCRQKSANLYFVGFRLEEYIGREDMGPQDQKQQLG